MPIAPLAAPAAPASRPDAAPSAQDQVRYAADAPDDAPIVFDGAKVKAETAGGDGAVAAGLSPAAAALPRLAPYQGGARQARAEPRAPEAGPGRSLRQRAADAARRLRAWLWPPVHMPEVDGGTDYMYHGTSFEALKAIVAGGGAMKAVLSYYADEYSFPRGYARSSARKSGSDGFVLQFERGKVMDKLTVGHYQPVVAQARGGAPVAQAGFFMAKEDVPLADMTDSSKRNILGWLARQREADPRNGLWPGLIADFERALGMAAPPAPDMGPASRLPRP